MQELKSFNDGWKFHFGDIETIRNRWGWAKSGSFNQGPESKAYDDSDWKNVTLPHDFVFETKVYDYSEKEVKMIFDYLEKELKNARNKFNGSDSEEGKFSLH